jgi:Protein of unknown function (DUF3014)
MMQLSDLQLDKWNSPVEPERPRAWPRVLLAVVILGALGAGGYYWLRHRPQPAPADVRAQTEQPVARNESPKPVAEAGEVIDLPPLAQSDAIVRQLVSGLSTHPAAAAWLAGDQLVRNFTVSVYNIAGGRNPSAQLNRLRPAQKFEVRRSGTDLTIDPRSYARYDVYGDAMSALDARGAARLYATLKPRIQDAYRELGHPDDDFDRVLARAIDELLATPVVEGRVALASKSVSYEFADPRLQSLSSAQRQLLRMGPRNVKLIQAKLREIAPLLGITVSRLP